jgi:hypothetical protein
VSEVDDGHPSRSKLALNRVTLAEDRGEGRLGGLGHGFAPAAEDENERVASGRGRDNTRRWQDTVAVRGGLESRWKLNDADPSVVDGVRHVGRIRSPP